jgi:hypothetical protein
MWPQLNSTGASLRGKCSSESKKESQIYQSSCGEKGKRKPELDQVVREPEPHTIKINLLDGIFNFST